MIDHGTGGHGRGDPATSRHANGNRIGRWPLPERIRMPFRVMWEDDGLVLRLLCHGELDQSTYPLLDRVLRKTERGPQRTVIVDLAEVTFLDAGGVSLLLQAAARAVACRRSLNLENPQPGVLRLLQITKATHLLEPSRLLEDLQLPTTA